MLKIGFSTAMNCLQNANEIIPEAIIVGTGKGSMHDTEQFLTAIKTYQETALNATNFIHSTYNQLNGMIALNQKINSYNNTFVHKGFSLEHAIIDAQLLLNENDIKTALVGSYDEMTIDHFNVKKQWNFWKHETINSLELFNHSNTIGTIAGEGSGFFLLSNSKPSNTSISISFIETLYNPTLDDFNASLQQLINETGIQLSEIDIVISGKNGDANQVGFFNVLEKETSTAETIFFKHLCGEYDTAINFALWLGNSILLNQKTPNSSTKKDLKTVLIYNNYFEKNQSLILLELED